MEAVEVNDLVIHEENLYLVQSIDLSLGFSIWEIVSMNGNVSKKVSRLQIDKIVLDLLTDIGLEEDEKVAGNKENTCESSGKENERFHNPNQEEIDAMKAARLRDSTENQTKWAVKIIKGM